MVSRQPKSQSFQGRESIYQNIFRKSPLLVSRSGLLSPKQTLHSIELLYLLGGIIIRFDEMSLDSSPRIISNSTHFLFKIQEEKKQCKAKFCFLNSVLGTNPLFFTTTMPLKNIPFLVSPDLLKVMSEMGHGDTIGE